MRYNRRIEIRITEEQYVLLKGIKKTSSEIFREAVERECKRKSVRTTSVQHPYKDKIEEIYSRYPRKIGKGAGFKRVQSLSDEDLSLFSLAVDNYASHVKKNATEPKYVKHFSTFVNQWRDWINPVQESAFDNYDMDLIFGSDVNDHG